MHWNYRNINSDLFVSSLTVTEYHAQQGSWNFELCYIAFSLFFKNAGRGRVNYTVMKGRKKKDPQIFACRCHCLVIGIRLYCFYAVLNVELMLTWTLLMSITEAMFASMTKGGKFLWYLVIRSLRISLKWLKGISLCTHIVYLKLLESSLQFIC